MHIHNGFMLIIMNSTSSFAEIEKVQSINGLPRTIVTDNSTAFTSYEFTSFVKAKWNSSCHWYLSCLLSEYK